MRSCIGLILASSVPRSGVRCCSLLSKTYRSTIRVRYGCSTSCFFQVFLFWFSCFFIRFWPCPCFWFSFSFLFLIRIYIIVFFSEVAIARCVLPPCIFHNVCCGLAQIAYYSFKVVQLHMLAEVTFYTGGTGAPRLCIRSQAPQYAPLALQLLEGALRQ